MTEEEKIEADKAKVAALKNAQANIKASIERIEMLERVLAMAICTIEDCAKYYVPPSAYKPVGNSYERLSENLKRSAAEYRNAL